MTYNNNNNSSPLKVLVSNDDGYLSPILPILIHSLKNIARFSEVRVVVPDEERSWAGKFISRFTTLEPKDHSIDGHHCYLVNGFPADCVALGIHNLYPEKPDLVISGINMGKNSSLPFFLSSGTIGAATEGYLHGVPSIALSAVMPSEVFSEWRQLDEITFANKYSANLEAITKAAMKLVLQLLQVEFWEFSDIVSANIPWDCSSKTETVITHVSEARFTKMFRELSEKRYAHVASGPMLEHIEQSRPDNTMSDAQAVRDNKLGVSFIKYGFISQLPSILSTGIFPADSDTAGR